jgi:uncharacterized protein GlcG (DUF336 family)
MHRISHIGFHRIGETAQCLCFVIPQQIYRHSIDQHEFIVLKSSLNRSRIRYLKMVRLLSLFALLPLALASLDIASETNLKPASPSSGNALEFTDLRTIIDASVRKATEISSPSNIAITDPAGHLLAFLRMDGAVLASIDVSQRKARTVSMFGGKFRTADLQNATAPGGPVYGLQHTNNGLIFFGGGVPIVKGGVFVGGLGISGGTTDQDVSIANAGAGVLS